MFRETVELHRQASIGAADLASKQANLARVLAALGKNDESIALLEQIVPVLEDAKRNSPLNQLTRLHALINKAQCEQTQDLFAQVLDSVSAIQEKNWRRMRAEMLLANLALTCSRPELAKELVKAGLAHSKLVFSPGSQGATLVASEAAHLLTQIQLLVSG